MRCITLQKRQKTSLISYVNSITVKVVKTWRTSFVDHVIKRNQRLGGGGGGGTN